MPIIARRDNPSTTVIASGMDRSLNAADAIAVARKMGKMLVTDLETVREIDERALINLADLNSAQMLANYEAHMANYQTLPTDPEGAMVRFYRGEWTIWSGFPGTGKTTFLRHMCMNFLKFMDDGECVFIATLEQDAQWYVIELAATAAGVQTPTAKQLDQFLDRYRDKLRIWGGIGIADHRRLIATVRHLAEKEGCKHAVIDSLMMLDVDSDDNEVQRKFANLVTVTCKAYGVHIHLVAHPRKPMGPDQEPNVWDIAGSSDLGRIAWNVFFVRRGENDTSAQEGVSKMILHVLKQRTRGKIGEHVSYFYTDQRQFHSAPFEQEPTHYLPDDSYPEPGLMREIPKHMIDDPLPKSAFRVDREELPPLTSNPWEI